MKQWISIVTFLWSILLVLIYISHLVIKNIR
ncbi:MAG: hypothetical protein KatS3mg089_0677 [Patescibacteria group bacterium]|nr:MAG: hypothetical protein KatS3mg089_0677 [Patescibacteria group bacterium]